MITTFNHDEKTNEIMNKAIKDKKFRSKSHFIEFCIKYYDTLENEH